MGGPGDPIEARRPLHVLHAILERLDLAREARRYGDVGGRPQVVWTNGGPGIDRCGNRHRSPHGLDPSAFVGRFILTYQGQHTELVVAHPRLAYIPDLPARIIRPRGWRPSLHQPLTIPRDELFDIGVTGSAWQQSRIRPIRTGSAGCSVRSQRGDGQIRTELCIGRFHCSFRTTRGLMTIKHRFARGSVSPGRHHGPAGDRTGADRPATRIRAAPEELVER